MKGSMLIDGQKIEFNDEKNILEVVRKAGIDLPVFCYHSELSVYGACRMCIVEDNRGRIVASCSTPPKDGMEIYTNTPKIRKHRKMILELILSNHDRDCTSCHKTLDCKLQEFAIRYEIDDIRFGQIEEKKPIDNSSLSIVRNPNKCILCGDCVRVCQEVQGVGALGFAYRGSDVQVIPPFNANIGDVDCVNCGQCRAVCPTGAITIKSDVDKFWDVLYDKNKKVVVQIAPAVRVALGEEFGIAPGETTIGKIVAALKKLGADEVYDTCFAADMTVIEESNEFFERLETGGPLPLFTSCCPAWVKHAENKFPEMVENISTCRSPQQMFGSTIKHYFKKPNEIEEKETIVVSIMPCTAKKAEAARSEFSVNGVRDVDIVITTHEFAMMIREAGIIFDELEEEALDMPFGMASGAGVIFGVTGGVAEAVLRRCVKGKINDLVKEGPFQDVRGMEGTKEAVANIDGNEIRVAVVHGLKNAERLIKRMEDGEATYHLIEVMACPGGCIAGGGQTIPVTPEVREQRAKGLYDIDRISQIKRSEENPMIISLFNDMLKGRHDLLHVHRED